MRCFGKRCVVVLLLAGAAGAGAQETPEAPVTAPPGAAAPRGMALETLLRGSNVAVTFSGVHDSSIGWYTVLTPAVSYTFSPRYSADASLSVYPTRNVEASTGRLETVYGDTGDTLLAAHASFYPRGTLNTTTLAVTLPTGNQADGLGLGTATVDVSNHSERYFGRKGVLLDVGLGDSSGLFNRLVPTEDSTLAPIAHFQAGAVVPLPLSSYLQTTAYEQLPLGDQKIYTAVPGRPGTVNFVVTGRKVSEDNGFANVMTVPLTDHVLLSGYYTRSLRLHLDTVSVGLTYTWKGSRRRAMSMIDKAIAEAERGVQ